MQFDIRADYAVETIADRALLMSVIGQGIPLQRPAVRPWRKELMIGKRLRDVALTWLLLPLILPLMAICAALIWLESPGPVMYSRMRTGRGGTPFKMFK